MKKYSHCVDCKKSKTKNISKRCQKCFGKIHSKQMKNNKFALKDGHTLKKYYCKCGKQLYDFNSKRCVSCENKRRHKLGIIDNKGKNNPMYGVSRFGKDNPCYIDGRSYEDYPKEFTSKLRNEIRKRDNYKCQYCGMTEEEHYQKYNRNLEIHHINGNKKDCGKRNLITTCKSCNIQKRDEHAKN